MSIELCQPANKAVIAFCRHATETVEIKATAETIIHEFEDCKYHLMRTKGDPDTLLLSFKHRYSLAEQAVRAARNAYDDGFACVRLLPEDGYQLTLEVSIDV